MAKKGLSPSTEDYLKAVYRLTEDGGAAPTNRIAEELDVAAPSVSGMVKRLADHGLLEHAPYRGVTLTRSGRRAALRVLRRHRLIEAYLVEFLGYTWDAVHDEAERLEHAVSDELVERIARALGDPAVDPHGDPIPGADGNVETVETTPLADLAEGADVVLERVTGASSEALRWLAGEGLVPGVQLRVMRQPPFGGGVFVRARGKERHVGVELARRLQCSYRSRS